ncbi:MAG: hypothetical protein ABI867_22185 [Kofleriaceae bacterium]
MNRHVALLGIVVIAAAFGCSSRKGTVAARSTVDCRARLIGGEWRAESVPAPSGPTGSGAGEFGRAVILHGRMVFFADGDRWEHWLSDPKTAQRELYASGTFVVTAEQGDRCTVKMPRTDRSLDAEYGEIQLAIEFVSADRFISDPDHPESIPYRRHATTITVPSVAASSPGNAHDDADIYNGLDAGWKAP